MIEICAKDYPGFGNASLDLSAPGRPGRPHGPLDERVHTFLGASHVNLAHYEWGIELLGGPKLREVYLAARPSFGRFEAFKPLLFVRFVEREIRRHVGRCRSREFATLLRQLRNEGRENGRREAQLAIREAMGIDD